MAGELGQRDLTLGLFGTLLISTALYIGVSLVVVGMVSNGFSIADPADPEMLDVVGFDTATPQLISDFARGAL